MLSRHFDHWPKRAPKSLVVPETNPYHNLEVSAARYPNKVDIHYYGGEIRTDSCWRKWMPWPAFCSGIWGLPQGIGCFSTCKTLRSLSSPITLSSGLMGGMD